MSSELSARAGDWNLQLKTGHNYYVCASKLYVGKGGLDTSQYVEVLCTDNEQEAIKALTELKTFCENSLKHITNNRVFKECLTLAEKEAAQATSQSLSYPFSGLNAAWKPRSE